MSDKALQNFNNQAFRNNLITWYEKNKRSLPWRETTDPYAIWVSEIMLQQTKVDTVISYYKKFMNRYPTIFHLAEADEQEVLKEWEGLGYYSRARHLHQAAKEVVNTYGGKVPQDQKSLSTLKGIGPYTKGAILSIAFNQAEPAVDGNVMRVLSRVLFIEENISEQRVRKRMEHIVKELICKENPSSFNQGLMELGALICSPRTPACSVCPVQKECRAYEAGVPEELPIKWKKKKQKVKPYIVLLIYDEQGNVAIEQRPKDGLLASMWQFPMVEESIYRNGELLREVYHTYGLNIQLGKEVGRVQHVFSHLIWELTVLEARCLTIPMQQNLRFLSYEHLEQYPFSVSHNKIKSMLT